MSIKVFNADVKFKLRDKLSVTKFIEERVTKSSGKKIAFTYVFCSDEFLLDINRRFLNHDFYTDIITFPLSENDKVIEAEIYISVDRVKDNALKLKLDFEEELHRVMFHGALHLLGLKDKTKAQKLAMRKGEEEWLKKFNV